MPAQLDRWPSAAIEQGYIAIDDDGTEVRVRRHRDTTTLTVKSVLGKGSTFMLVLPRHAKRGR